MAQKFLHGIDISGNLTVDSHSAVDSTVFDISGSQGQLFSITNSLTGDLFSVSDISGIPIFNVNSSGAVDIDGTLNLGDSNKIQLGASQDLQIYHDGTNSYIDEVGDGDLIIKGGNDIIFRDAVGNLLVNMNQSNSVELYYGGSKKLETTSAGIDITGEVKGDSLDIDGNADISGSLDVNGTESDIAFVGGSMNFKDSNDYIRITKASASAQLGLFRSSNAVGGMYIGGSNTGFRIYTESFSQKFHLDQSGNATFAGTIGSGAITSTSAVTGTRLVANGTGNAIELNQSATGSATYYVMDNTVETGGKRYRFGYSGGSSDKGSFSIYNQTDSLMPLLLSGANATFGGTVKAATTFIADAVSTSNNDPGADNVQVSGYGMIGNRGNLYITNASTSGSATVQIGVGGVHNGSPKLSVGTTVSSISTNLHPGADSTYNIGSNASRFANIYADTLYGDGSNLTNLPSQISGLATENYVDTAVSNLIDNAPENLNTLYELAEALNDDDDAVVTINTALGNRVRVDTASQGLNSTQKSNARTNIGAGTSSLTIGTTSTTAMAGDTTIPAAVTDFVSKANGGTFDGNIAVQDISMGAADRFTHGSYLELSYGASNTSQFTFNADYDGSQTGTYTPHYSGTTGSGMSVVKMPSGGVGGLDFYVKQHGTTTGSHNISTFTKILELNQNGISTFGGNVVLKGDLLPNADTTYDIGSNALKWAEGHFDHLFIGETGNNPRIDIYTENGTASLADTFSDTSTDKSYIYFQAGTSSNDPGFIMHETSESSSPDERNEGVLHLVPSDDNGYGDYVSIHGTNDPDALKLHTSGAIETASNYQLALSSGSGSVKVDDSLDVTGSITVAGTVDGVDISALPTSFAPVSAEQNVQSDWNATSGDALILNKPSIPAAVTDYVSKANGGTFSGATLVNAQLAVNSTTVNSANKLEVHGQARINGKMMIGDSTISNVPNAAVQLHVKNAGQAGIRLEDSDSTNLAFDVIVDEGVGFLIKETVGGDSGDDIRLTIAESTGAVTIGGTISASNLSGTNTGDQTNISGNAATATTATNSTQLNGFTLARIDNAESFHTFTGINASNTQAKRYHIGRLYGCPAHWDSNWQNMDINVTAEHYESGHLRYRLMGDYGGSGSQANMMDLYLKEASGPMVGRFRFVLSDPVDAGWNHSGQDTFYVDLYAEAAHYSQWEINIKTYGHGTQSTNPTSGGAVTVLYDSPTVSNVSTFNEGHTAIHHLGDEIYHEGHKPTLTELGAQAAGSYLTSDTNYLKSNADDDFSGKLTGTGTAENLKIGGIRGTTKGSQTGEYIHLYERVHIGGPSGWGDSTHGAPSNGLSTWGSVDFGMNGSGVIQLDGTTIVTAARALTNISDYGLTSSDIPNNAANTSGSSGSCTGNAATATTASAVAYDNVTNKPYIEVNNITSATSTETVISVAHATYTAAFFDFVIKNGTNVRAGTVYACHNGASTPLVEFAETSTVDLGDTSDVTLSVDISGTNMRLRATSTSSTWTIKTLIRAI